MRVLARLHKPSHRPALHTSLPAGSTLLHYAATLNVPPNISPLLRPSSLARPLPADMSSRRPTHRGPQLSLSASIDLDVEGGSNARLDESYDAGWRTVDLPWSAKGPASSLPTLTLLESAKAHLSWARDGWVESMRWSEAARVIRR